MSFRLRQMRKEEEEKKVKKAEAKVKKKQTKASVQYPGNETIRYTLPQYQGRSANKGETYEWERDNLKNVKGRGRGYDERFQRLMDEAGVPRHEQKDFRRWLDAQEDSAQEVKYNKDGSQSKRGTIHSGQGMITRTQAIDDILNGVMQNNQNQAAHSQQVEQLRNDLLQESEKERGGILGFLDSTVGRFSDAFTSNIMNLVDPNFREKQNENYERITQNKLNSGDIEQMQEAMASAQRLNTTNREAEGWVEKGADITGDIAAEIAKYFPAYSAAGVLGRGVSRLAPNLQNAPKFARELGRGAAAGTMVGTTRAIANERADENNELGVGDFLGTVGLEAALAGGGDAAIGAILRNVNLKGQLRKLLEDSGMSNPTEEQMARALQDAFGQRGNPTNVLNNSINPQEGLSRANQILDDMLGSNRGQVQQADNILEAVQRPQQNPELDQILRTQEEVFQRRQLEEDAFVQQRVQPFEEMMQRSAEAEIQFGEVKNAKDLKKRIQQNYGKIIIPEGNQSDWGKEVTLAFRAKKGEQKGIDIYTFAEQEGFNSVDEAVQFLKNIDEMSKQRLSDFRPPDNMRITNDQYEELINAARQEFNNTDAARGLDDYFESLLGAQREIEAPSSQVSSAYAPDNRFNINTDVLAPSPVNRVDEMLQSFMQRADSVGAQADDLASRVSTQGSRQESPVGAVAGRVNEYTGSPIAEPTTLAKKIKDGKTSLKGTIQKLKTELFSDLQPIKDVERLIAAKDAEKILRYTPDGSLSVLDSLYKNLRGVRRATAKALNTIEQSYKPILESLDKANISRLDFEEFALAKHADDILRNNREKMIRAQEVRDDLVRIEEEMMNTTDKERLRELEQYEKALANELNELNPYILPKEAQSPEWVASRLQRWQDNPVMQKAQQDFVREQHRDLDMLLEAGVRSADQIQAMKDAHPNYISMVRDKADADPIFGVSSNISKPRSHIKKRGEGSEEKIVSPLDSALRNRILAVTNAERNKAMQKIVQLSKIDGADQYFRRVNPDLDNFDNMSTVQFFEDGQPVFYEVPQTLRNAFDNLDNKTAESLVKNAGRAIATVVRKGSTHYNLEFILRSVIRDTQAPLVQSRSGMNPSDLVLGYMDSFMGKNLEKWSKGKFKSYNEFYKQHGGEMSGYISMDSQSLSKATKALNKGKLAKGIDIINPFKAIERLGAATERAPKLAELRSATRKGYSPEDAMFEAVDVIDYSDAGTLVRKANQFIPFLNPAIRGNTRILQSLKDNPQKFMGKGLMYITMPTAAIYAMRHASTTSDEQRSKLNNLQEWQKNMFWYIPVPNSDDDKLLAIPKGHLVAQLFANPLERALDKMFDNKDKTVKTIAKETVKDLFKNLAPPMGIAGASELIEAVTNYDLFTETPIEDAAMQRKRPEERYNVYTSELAKMIGDATGGSPARIDHVIKGLTGGVGRDALDLMDNIVAETGDRPAKVNSIDEILNPLMGFQYDDTAASGRFNDLYNIQQQETWDGLEDTPAQGLYEEFREINKEIKSVREDKSLSSKEKRKQISQLRKIQRELGDQAINQGLIR